MNKTKPVRQLKRETLVRKVRELERTVGVYSATIEHRNLSITVLTNRLDDVKMSNDVWKQKMERLKRQHNRRVRDLQGERDDWHYLAVQETKRRLYAQHDLRISNRRWEDEEEPDEKPVETHETAGSPVGIGPSKSG